MQRKFREPPLPFVEVSHTGVFRAVVAHEDLASCEAAIETCKLLAEQLGDEVEFRSSIWQFTALGNAGKRELAAIDAYEADMVIIAPGRAGDLPAVVKEWVNAWAASKLGQTAALVALQPREVNVTALTASESFLKQAASTAGLDFFTRRLQIDSVLPESPVSGPRPGAWRPPESWGLND